VSKFYRLDADMNGTDSIQDYIDDGRIINLPCATFADFDRHRQDLMRTLEPGDNVMLDTASALLTTTRIDRMLGNRNEDALWDPSKINKFFGDKEYLAVYNMATSLVMRGINNFRARGAHVIVLTHEDEVRDAMAGLKMAGPQGNPAFVEALIASSSDVFRLVSLTDPVVDEKGNTIFARETRVLYLRRTESATAKFHVSRELSEKIPKALPDPTLPKLWKVLGKQSSVLTIYGHPGAGKTSLGATASDQLITTNNTTKKAIAK
jgi:hypothetical protein